MTALLQPGKLLPFHWGASDKGWHQIQPITICPKEYQLSRVRHITPRNAFMRDPLAIGLLLHVGRAQWLNDGYKGKLWRKAMRSFYEEIPQQHGGLRLNPGVWETAESTFEGYVSHWAIRPKPKVLAVEYLLKPRGLTPDAPEWAWRGGRLDSIERDAQGTWIGECKSTSNSAGRVHDTYEANGQTLLYAALWGEEETERFGPLAGILLDVMKKSTPGAPAKFWPRIRLPISDLLHPLKSFKRDFTTWVMQSHLVDWNASVERRWTCQRETHQCEYKDLCLLGKKASHLYTLEDGSPLNLFKRQPGKEVLPWS
jgi:hypothetical protein